MAPSKSGWQGVCTDRCIQPLDRLDFYLQPTQTHIVTQVEFGEVGFRTNRKLCKVQPAHLAGLPAVKVWWHEYGGGVVWCGVVWCGVVWRGKLTRCV
jgi:hypothetical protein